MVITSSVVEINWVSKWTYDCINSECPICRFSINESQSLNKISVGECGHGFHTKCLNEWFKQIGHNTNTKCTVCLKQWKKKYKKGINNTVFNFFPQNEQFE